MRNKKGLIKLIILIVVIFLVVSGYVVYGIIRDKVAEYFSPGEEETSTDDEIELTESDSLEETPDIQGVPDGEIGVITLEEN